MTNSRRKGADGEEWRPQITRVCNGKRKHFRKKGFMYYDEYKENKQQKERK